MEIKMKHMPEIDTLGLIGLVRGFAAAAFDQTYMRFPIQPNRYARKQRHGQVQAQRIKAKASKEKEP
jgi:hypothetical protein